MYGEIEFECNHWSVFENAIDMAHIHYLHNDTFGNQVGRIPLVLNGIGMQQGQLLHHAGIA